MVRRRRKLRALIIVATGLLAVVAWFGRATVFAPLARPLLALAGPVHGAGAKIRAAAAALGGSDGGGGLLAENEELRLQNARLKALAAENEALKQALAFVERERDFMITGRVISEVRTDAFYGLVIDRGRGDGLAAGQPVVAADGILIGRVFEVGLWTSSVLLLTDPNSKIAVTVLNSRSTLGVLEGDRGLAMRMTLIPQTEDLTTGDAVITSGIEPGIRRGLVAGTIGSIEKNQREPFQSATVLPFTVAQHPIFVQVLLPPPTVEAAE